MALFEKSHETAGVLVKRDQIQRQNIFETKRSLCVNSDHNFYMYY